MKRSLSLVIPIHNESLILKQSLTTLLKYSKTSIKKYSVDIILVENGTTSTNNSLKSKSVKIISIPQRSLGQAILAGFSHSKSDIVMFYAIDLPFGVSIIQESLKQIEKGYDVVIGSKKHPLSKTKIAIDRRLFSFCYNHLLRFLFKTKVRDTQGSIVLTRQLYKEIQPKLRGSSAWIQAQIIILAQKIQAKIIEIPVNLKPTRPSKMNYKDALNMIIETIKYK